MARYTGYNTHLGKETSNEPLGKLRQHKIPMDIPRNNTTKSHYALLPIRDSGAPDAGLPTIGIGRFANTIFRFTIATMSQLFGAPFVCCESCSESSTDIDSPGASSGASARCSTASGFARFTSLPSSRWWPINSVGLFCWVIRGHEVDSLSRFSTAYRIRIEPQLPDELAVLIPIHFK